MLTMGWTDTHLNKRRQHIQVIAKGTIRDIDRIQRRDARKRLFIVLDIIAIACLLIGVA